MIKLWIEGGFHNVPRFMAKPTKYKHLYQLSSRQVKRINDRLCGLKSCNCGGINEARLMIEGELSKANNCFIIGYRDDSSCVLSRLV
jgi:hypothetical protein